METAKVEAATSRQEKHIELDTAISRIDGVLTKVQTLTRRVLGEDAPPDNEKNCDIIRPTLLSVLSGAPELIDDKCSHIHSALDQLEEHLF